MTPEEQERLLNLEARLANLENAFVCIVTVLHNNTNSPQAKFEIDAVMQPYTDKTIERGGIKPVGGDEDIFV